MTAKILIIDGQGGRIGKLLVEAVLARLPEAQVTAVGTNANATACMAKGGATRCATGENAVVVNSARADVIAGPIGIVIANALLGEITPAMAVAVGSSDAQKVLLPMNRHTCHNAVVGVAELPLAELVRRAAEDICRAAGQPGCR